jgi:hypothetical protein
MVESAVGGGFYSALSPYDAQEPVFSSASITVAVSGGGDINADGVIDLVDVILSLQILTHTTPQSNITLTGDVDNDQNIGVAEAIYGLRSVAGLLP